MKRRYFALLLLFALICAALAGCHGSTGPGEFVMPDSFELQQ